METILIMVIVGFVLVMLVGGSRSPERPPLILVPVELPQQRGGGCVLLLISLVLMVLLVAVVG